MKKGEKSYLIRLKREEIKAAEDCLTSIRFVLKDLRKTSNPPVPAHVKSNYKALESLLTKVSYLFSQYEDPFDEFYKRQRVVVCSQYLEEMLEMYEKLHPTADLSKISIISMFRWVELYTKGSASAHSGGLKGNRFNFLSEQ